jgi:hypothetical protein
MLLAGQGPLGRCSPFPLPHFKKLDPKVRVSYKLCGKLAGRKSTISLHWCQIEQSLYIRRVSIVGRKIPGVVTFGRKYHNFLGVWH